MIAAEGGQIVAIMPDRQKFVADFKSQSNVPFPILTDMDNGYALSLNLTMDPDYRKPMVIADVLTALRS